MSLKTPSGKDIILVCVSPSPFSIRLVRSTQRMAESLGAEWFALYVETPTYARLPQNDQESVSQTLRLASQLGARTIKVSGFRVRDEILEFARNRHVTKIVVGKPINRRLREMLFGSIVDQLIWNCGDIDIYVISGEEEVPHTAGGLRRKRKPLLFDFARATAGVGICTVAVWALSPYLDLANLMMIYLLAIVAIAAYLGRGPSFLASCLSVAIFDFFFVPPHYTFAVESTEYAVTLGVMLLISALVSDLTARVRHQAKTARIQEHQTAALYEMSRNLTDTQRLEDVLGRAVEQISTIFQSRATILLPGREGGLKVHAGGPLSEDEDEPEVAEWVYRLGRMAGSGLEDFPGAKGIYLPLRALERVIGVLRLEKPDRVLDVESLRFLEALGSQTAVAVERDDLARQAHLAEVQMATEKLRNALLSSVSHDLRTPLTVIAGSASSLLEGEASLDGPTKHELTQSIYDEACRLDRLVHNILDMSRLQSGEIRLHKEWYVPEEVIGTALTQLEAIIKSHPVHVHLPAALPMVRMDALFMERVFINLIDNAVKYSPAGGSIEISGKTENGRLLLEVADQGPGIQEGEKERIFEKFYQLGSGQRRGAGLGLAICRSIMTAHGGQIWADNGPDGGAVFRFTLPIEEGSPIEDKPLPEIEDANEYKDPHLVD